MSDFGCVLLFTKSDGELNSQDKQKVIEKLDEIIPDSDYSFMIQDGDYRTFSDWGDGIQCIRLTEHYDDEDEELAEFAEEDELPDAEEIAQILQDLLGDGYEVKAEFTGW
ncbi:MAG: hypothetical protein H6607_06230 [Flavobacteriales bacterium]|nr:hypothetical protein [Flavobacteriales bacterium]